MNKTQIVLQEENEEKNVVNLWVAYYGILFPHKVQTYRRGNETYFRFTHPKYEKEHKPFEYTRLRAVTEAFLRIETSSQALQFLEQYGPIDVDKTFEPKTVKWSDLLTLQSAFRESWVTSYRDWHRDIKNLVFDFDLNFDAGNLDYLQLNANTDTVKKALAADLIFTALSELPSAFCARPDCRKLFQKGTKHDRKYCSQECAHIESVRKHRARKSGGK